MDLTDNSIIPIKKGNRESFKEFFNNFYPILCSFANKYLKDQDQSKDAAQEAFIKFWKKRKEFDSIEDAKKFLYVVVKNNCINRLKKSKRNLDFSSLKELETDSFLKKAIIDQETFSIVRNAVQKLPNRQKKIVELSMQSIKNPEIATQLEISLHTVHTAKKNAYRKLREILKDKHYLSMFI